MSQSTMSHGSIDFRVQPPWRWDENDPEPKQSIGGLGYQRVYGADYKRGHTFHGLQADLRNLGLKAIVHSEPTSDNPSKWNDQVYEVIRRAPDLFVGGFCCADPRDIMAGVREIERSHSDLGLRGLTLLPDFYNIDLSDKRCYPLIAKAADLGIPVALHVGVNFTSTSPIRHGHPSHVDEIACHFPDVTLICCHGGWPWPTEMIAVAWKHKNVFLEFGAIAPKYLASAVGGWEPMRHFMNSKLQDRILLGSDWPMMKHDRIFEELPALGLKDSVLEKYTRLNALAVLDKMNSR